MSFFYRGSVGANLHPWGLSPVVWGATGATPCARVPSSNMAGISSILFSDAIESVATAAESLLAAKEGMCSSIIMDGAGALVSNCHLLRGIVQ